MINKTGGPRPLKSVPRGKTEKRYSPFSGSMAAQEGPGGQPLAAVEGELRRSNPRISSPDAQLDGKTVAAIILGLIGILFVIMLPVPVLSIIGLILAHIARAKIDEPENRKMNNWALGLNWAGIVIAFVIWLLFFILMMDFFAFPQ